MEQAKVKAQNIEHTVSVVDIVENENKIINLKNQTTC